MTQPVQTIDVLLAEHADLERRLSDPDLHSNPDEARKAGRRFARLAPIVGTYRKLMAAREDLGPRANWPPTTIRSPPRSPTWNPGWPSWTPS